MVSTSVGQLSAFAGQNHQLLLPELGLIFWTGIKFLLFQEPDLESGSGSIYV
jgi:hypothetical protein